mmetsp:Transcript_75706/g.202500  ORF Transcript_75706/g.202500 Transcript_75706/m.202500 type:complete len:337 (+) Transcript_75706:732-1742(+)
MSFGPSADWFDHGDMSSGPRLYKYLVDAFVVYFCLHSKLWQCPGNAEPDVGWVFQSMQRFWLSSTMPRLTEIFKCLWMAPVVGGVPAPRASGRPTMQPKMRWLLLPVATVSGYRNSFLADRSAGQAIMHELRGALSHDVERFAAEQPAGRARIFNVLLGLIVLVIVAAAYSAIKGQPRLDSCQAAAKRSSIQAGLDTRTNGRPQFGHSLFSCFDSTAVCVMAFCCAPIRWADTARLAGWFPFWVAVGLMCLVQLGNIFGLFGFALFVGVGAYFRQKIRLDFGMETGGMTVCADCLSYTFCPCCSVAQEAQQYEDAWAVAHPVAKEVSAMTREIVSR